MTMPKISGSTRVTDLTVTQLQRLIRHTVQEAMAEVLVEIAAIREMDEADLRDYEADLREYVQASTSIGTSVTASNRKQDD